MHQKDVNAYIRNNSSCFPLGKKTEQHDHVCIFAQVQITNISCNILKQNHAQTLC